MKRNTKEENDETRKRGKVEKAGKVMKFGMKENHDFEAISIE